MIRRNWELIDRGYDLIELTYREVLRQDKDGFGFEEEENYNLKTKSSEEVEADAKAIKEMIDEIY
jgi:hypothetical protein